VITSHQCKYEAIVLVTPKVLQPSPLKESRPEILGRDPLGGTKKVCWCVAFSFSQVSQSTALRMSFSLQLQKGVLLYFFLQLTLLLTTRFSDI
jgi:hypothetical protein